MAVVRQAEAVVAGAAVIPGDVDALVDAARVVLPLTLIDICRGERERRAGGAGSSRRWFFPPAPWRSPPQWIFRPRGSAASLAPAVPAASLHHQAPVSALLQQISPPPLSHPNFGPAAHQPAALSPLCLHQQVLRCPASHRSSPRCTPAPGSEPHAGAEIWFYPREMCSLGPFPLQGWKTEGCPFALHPQGDAWRGEDVACSAPGSESLGTGQGPTACPPGEQLPRRPGIGRDFPKAVLGTACLPAYLRWDLALIPLLFALLLSSPCRRRPCASLMCPAQPHADTSLNFPCYSPSSAPFGLQIPQGKSPDFLQRNSREPSWGWSSPSPADAEQGKKCGDNHGHSPHCPHTASTDQAGLGQNKDIKGLQLPGV